MGYLRLAAALAVMHFHLTHMAYGLAWGAVLLFYALSGYLSTLLMATRYEGRPVDFLVSRWLRLWPVYLVVFFGTIALFWLDLIPVIGSDLSSLGLFRQTFMVTVMPTTSAVVPPAWMLKYILLAYLLAAVGALKTPTRALLLLGVSMVLASRLGIANGGPWWAYFVSTPLAVQYIAAGALCYHHGIVLPKDGRWAAIAGALSYPVFLSHWPVGDVVATLAGLGKGWPLFLASLAPTLLLSWLLVVAVERPIDRYRKSLQSRQGD